VPAQAQWKGLAICHPFYAVPGPLTRGNGN
jgi:hypothetical protein